MDRWQPHRVQQGRHLGGMLLLFIDNGHLGFPQFAGALRRRGVKVRAISYPLPTSRWRRKVHAFLCFLGYGEWHEAQDANSLRSCISKMPGPELDDVICGEFHLAEVIDAAASVGAPPATMARLRKRQEWADKADTYAALRKGGIPVPDFATDVDLATAIDRIGFPMVVKSRKGNGGYGVRLVSDSIELDQAVSALRSHGWGIVFEKYVPGRSLCYVAAFDNGRIIRDGVYDFLQRSDERTLPSTTSLTLDRPDVSALGHKVTGLIGGSDLINIDLIDSPNFGLVVVDVNLRVWGNIVALNSAGGFFELPYLAILGKDVDPGPMKSLVPGVRINMFPSAIEDGVRARAWKAAFRQLLLSSRDYHNWTDNRYLIAGSATLLIRTLAKAVKSSSSLSRARNRISA